MYNLNEEFSIEELIILKDTIGTNYRILDNIEVYCYVLCGNGSKSYNECFQYTDNNYLSKQFYDDVKPYRAILFYIFYIIEIVDEIGIWYRGRKDSNGNIELTCFSETLEDALESV